MHKFGWRPDLPDIRDYKFSAPSGVLIPKTGTVEQFAPAVKDQGPLGSCTAHGNHAILEALFIKLGVKPAPLFSRLQTYYNERKAEGTVRTDSGAQIRDGIKALAKLGVCHEALWPYDVTKFARKPPAKAYAEALKYKALTYQRVVTIDDMRHAIASGYPFVFGFTVYESFESAEVARTGIVPMPKPHERVLGGHCMASFTYDQTTFGGPNSWGTGWGRNGWYTIPVDYLANPNLSSDCWIITGVSGVALS